MYTVYNLVYKHEAKMKYTVVHSVVRDLYTLNENAFDPLIRHFRGYALGNALKRRHNRNAL